MARHREPTRIMLVSRQSSLCIDTCALTGEATSNEWTSPGLLLKISRCILLHTSSAHKMYDGIAERRETGKLFRQGLQQWLSDIRTFVHDCWLVLLG